MWLRFKRCGCDFPHAISQNPSWPEIEYQENFNEDAETASTHKHNREALVELLRGFAENVIELYGLWDGDSARSMKPPIRFALQRRASEISRQSGRRRWILFNSSPCLLSVLALPCISSKSLKLRLVLFSLPTAKGSTSVVVSSHPVC